MHTFFLTVCRKHHIHAKRADDLFDTRKTVTEDIINAIYQSEWVVADITKHNANVFFELGIAEALNKKIILLHQHDGDKIPTDITNKRYLSYGMYPASFNKFKESLGKIIDNDIKPRNFTAQKGS